MVDNHGASETLLDQIDELKNDLSVESSLLASRISSVDLVRANEGDIDEAKEAVRAQQIVVDSIEAHLRKLQKLAGHA